MVLAKELVLQLRKVIGPFAAPTKIFIVSDLPKTRSGKASPGVRCSFKQLDHSSTSLRVSSGLARIDSHPG
jgi:acyl-coenzyme A synthetase/AMP-(fatty) acid ligase